jgi:hypothetical protein
LQRTPAPTNPENDEVGTAEDGGSSIVETAAVAGLLFIAALGGAYVIGKRIGGPVS